MDEITWTRGKFKITWQYRAKDTPMSGYIVCRLNHRNGISVTSLCDYVSELTLASVYGTKYFSWILHNRYVHLVDLSLQFWITISSIRILKFYLAKIEIKNALNYYHNNFMIFYDIIFYNYYFNNFMIFYDTILYNHYFNNFMI